MDDLYLDLRGLKCPLPALKTGRALARAQTGSVVVVACTDPLASLDIPHLVHQTGDIIETQDFADGVATFRIRRR